MARPTLLDVAFSLPRYLLPRGIPNRSSHLIRHASSTPTKNASKGPRVLAKPTKYTPPSHPARLPRAAPTNFPGPPLSAKEIAAQKTKQYPHMMPAEGTFMRWFLTNRSIHIYITLVKHLSSGVCMLIQTSREARHLLMLLCSPPHRGPYSRSLCTPSLSTFGAPLHSRISFRRRVGYYERLFRARDSGWRFTSSRSRSGVGRQGSAAGEAWRMLRNGGNTGLRWDWKSRGKREM